MKNLHKKIKVILLSGAMLMGVGLSNLSVAHASSQSVKQQIFKDFYPIGNNGHMFLLASYNNIIDVSDDYIIKAFSKSFGKMNYFSFMFWDIDDLVDYLSKNKHCPGMYKASLGKENKNIIIFID